MKTGSNEKGSRGEDLSSILDAFAVLVYFGITPVHGGITTVFPCEVYKKNIAEDLVNCKIFGSGLCCFSG